MTKEIIKSATMDEYIQKGLDFLNKIPWQKKNDPRWVRGYIGNLKIQYRNERKCYGKEI